MAHQLEDFDVIDVSQFGSGKLYEFLGGIRINEDSNNTAFRAELWATLLEMYCQAEKPCATVAATVYGHSGALVHSPWSTDWVSDYADRITSSRAALWRQELPGMYRKWARQGYPYYCVTKSPLLTLYAWMKGMKCVGSGDSMFLSGEVNYGEWSVGKDLVRTRDYEVNGGNVICDEENFDSTVFRMRNSQLLGGAILANIIRPAKESNYGLPVDGVNIPNEVLSEPTPIRLLPLYNNIIPRSGNSGTCPIRAVRGMHVEQLSRIEDYYTYGTHVGTMFLTKDVVRRSVYTGSPPYDDEYPVADNTYIDEPCSAIITASSVYRTGLVSGYVYAFVPVEHRHVLRWITLGGSSGYGLKVLFPLFADGDGRATGWNDSDYEPCPMCPVPDDYEEHSREIHENGALPVNFSFVGVSQSADVNATISQGDSSVGNYLVFRVPAQTFSLTVLEEKLSLRPSDVECTRKSGWKYGSNTARVYLNLYTNTWSGMDSAWADYLISGDIEFTVKTPYLNVE